MRSGFSDTSGISAGSKRSNNSHISSSFRLVHESLARDFAVAVHVNKQLLSESLLLGGLLAAFLTLIYLIVKKILKQLTIN